MELQVQEIVRTVERPAPAEITEHERQNFISKERILEVIKQLKDNMKKKNPKKISSIAKIQQFLTINQNIITHVDYYPKKATLMRQISITHYCSGCHKETTNSGRCLIENENDASDDIKWRCKSCRNRKKFPAKTHEQFVKDIRKRNPFIKNIVFLSEYKHSLKPIKCFCTTHSQEFLCTPKALYKRRTGCKSCMGNISRISIECFEFIMLALNINIQHGYNHIDGEFCIPSSSPADGKFDGAITQLTDNLHNLFTIKHIVPNSLETIIEYNGYWTHGNERIDKPDKLIVHGRKCKDQWAHDNKKYNKYYQAGYNVIVIYEKDYKEIRKTDIFKQYREKINEKLLQYHFSSNKPTQQELINNSQRSRKKLAKTNLREKISAGLNPTFERNIYARTGENSFFFFRTSFKETLDEKTQNLNYSFGKKTLGLKKRLEIARKIRDVVDIMRENQGNYEKIKEVCDKIYKTEYLDKSKYAGHGFKSIYGVTNKIQKMDNGCGYKISKNAHNIRFNKRYFFKENGATKKNKRFGHLFCQSEEECKQRLIQHIWLKYIWRRYHPN